MNISYHMPVQMISGAGCVKKNAHKLHSLGKKCFIVTGKHSAKKSGALDDALFALDDMNIEYTIFNQITQNPLLSTCHKGGRLAKEFGADFVLGIGGGSSLDAAKAIAVFATNDILPKDIYSLDWEHTALPIALIGTSAGTGSEVTPAAVMTVDDNGRKMSIKRIDTYAKIALCDAKYTHTLPLSFTLSTALDALSHSLEGYFSSKANEISDFFAIEAVKLIVACLSEILKDPDNSITTQQRENLYKASIFGGLVINHTGTCYCHCLGYFLSEAHDVPHGNACAAFLPNYISRGKYTYPQKSSKLFSAVGASCEELCELIMKANKSTYPVGLDKDYLDQIAERYNGGGHFAHSPGEFTVEKAKELLYDMFS